LKNSGSADLPIPFTNPSVLASIKVGCVMVGYTVTGLYLLFGG
jgi:hypothetical protein